MGEIVTRWINKRRREGNGAVPIGRGPLPDKYTGRFSAGPPGRGKRQGKDAPWAETLRRLRNSDETGITGLETAIVLVAFVVVASVFAFTVLSSGVIATGRSEDTIIGGLRETASTLVLRGAVIATKNATTTTVDNVTFTITNASKAGEPVNLSTSGLHGAVLTFTDDNQTVNLGTWTPTWLSGSGSLVDSGESVEISIDVSGLSPKIGTDHTFAFQLKPVVGAVLQVKRTTPSEFFQVMNLN